MYMVGIGASAGGIEALKALLKGLSETQNACYFIAQHISPTHASLLGEILSRFTHLTVVNASNDLEPQRGYIYVTPPNHHIVIKAGKIHLINASELPSPKPSINRLFESLAENYGSNAIGIVLSGTGSDGASGLMAIRLAGGITIAQEPTTTEYSAMPLSAIESGAADLTLPIEEIPTVIQSANQLIHTDTNDKHWNAKYQYLINIINETANINLSQYKQSSLKRRIDRRMAIHQIQTIDDYLELVKSNPEEVKQFIKDVFISVTDFFRDPKAFDELAELIHTKLTNREINNPFRIWIPGCATGEEAYTFAILLEEIKLKQNINFSYQIFATDISDSALNLARIGKYSNRITETMPTELINRYFIQDNHKYEVHKFIKDNILFSKHDLIKDPPFSRIDLISCRNVLIYFNTALQEQVLMVFNFSLKPNGLLFLGQSESAQKYTGLFQEINHNSRVYRKVEGLNTMPLRMFSGIPLQSNPNDLTSTRVVTTREKKEQFKHDLEQTILELLTPAYVVIDENNEIVYTSEACSEFLSSKPGFSSRNILDNIIPEFSAGLRSLIFRFRENRQYHLDNRESEEPAGFNKTISLKKGTTSEFIRINLFAFNLANTIIILFEKLGIHYSQMHPRQQEESISKDDETVIYALNDELISTRESLQTLIEELETTNEELQATNEEMMSTNEELQAANEELQTSNEELQSSNEELQTVNDELALKNNELNQLNTQLNRIDYALGIPIIQLDQNYRIEYFNSHIADITDSDTIHLGDPFSVLPWLQKEPNAFKRRLEQLSKENTTLSEIIPFNDKNYEVTFVPYVVDNRANGIVMVFEDVSHFIDEQRQTSEQLNMALNTLEALGDAIIRTDENGLINLFNPMAEQILEHSREDACNQPLHKVLKLYDRTEKHPITYEAIKVLETEQSYRSSGAIILNCKTDRKKLVELISTPYHLDDDSRGALLILRDVTEKEALINQNEWRASHDPLTGVINRQFSEHQLERCIEKVAFKSEPCTFMYLDLDKFKIINDTAGHQAGDEALKHVIHLLRSQLRKRDQLGRLGGDEFGLILEGTLPLEAAGIAEKLIETVATTPFIWEQETYQLGLSIGILSLAAGDYSTLQNLLKDSDQAMYLAKKNGGNQYVVFDQNQPFFQNANQTSETMLRIQKGLVNGSFKLALQKIQAIQPNTPSGYECLMRFEDERGKLSPDDIIPLAERYGLIKQIDFKMVESAFGYIANQKEDHFFTINLSAHSFSDCKMADAIIELAHSNQIDFSKIVFEITETASITHYDHTNSFIAKLKPLGAKVFLDDFGSGFSSFSYLKKLQVDGLKIDGQFIQNLHQSQFDQIMVKSMIDIAKEMRIQTIAEFVEFDVVKEMLHAFEVDYLQGYLIEKPKVISPPERER